MAKTDDKVMSFVQDELRKNPDAKTSDLYEKAKGTLPSVKQLTVRQFHARYPLQIKRRQAAAAKDKQKEAKPARPRRRVSRRKAAAQAAGSNGDRDAIRKVLLKFAGDLSAAEARKDLVKVLANVDSYVDDVLKAAR